MFLKQYNYKPRSNSTSSQTSQTSSSDATKSTSTSGSPPKDEAKVGTENNGPLTSAMAGRRRSSSDGKFAGLQAHKRGSQDEQRKANWAEQKPGQSGILGGMWNSFTKGT